MTIRLIGATSGYTEIDAPAVAGNNTLLLPTGNGTADQALVTNGSGALSWSDRGRMTLATAQNSTSGTSIDFTGIPSWVKRVTVMFNGVSTNGTANLLLQIGAGSVTNTGYVCSAGRIASDGSAAILTSTAGLLCSPNFTGAAGNNYLGHAILTLISSNLWVMSAVTGVSSGTFTGSLQAAATVTLSGVLDRVRITTSNGTDTFDAGSINILYEG